MKYLTNFGKQKLTGIISIMIGIIGVYAIPEEIGWGIILIIIGIYFLFTKKQLLEFYWME